MGVSGGTILGDGSVVIILDLPAMIRNQSNLEYQHAKALDEIEAEKRQAEADRKQLKELGIQVKKPVVAETLAES